METSKKTESKLLDRVELEVLIPGKAGKISRGDALRAVAEAVKVEKARVGLISLEQQSGTTDVVGRFTVYGSVDAMAKVHPKHLAVRLLTKDEREKLKQGKKKTPAAQQAK